MRAAIWNAAAALLLVFLAIRSLRFTLWFAAIAIAIAVFLGLRAVSGLRKALNPQERTPLIR